MHTIKCSCSYHIHHDVIYMKFTPEKLNQLHVLNVCLKDTRDITYYSKYNMPIQQ